MNPFEDIGIKAPSTGDGTSSNPFTEDSLIDEDDQDTALVDASAVDAPAEASWQYLGNLPYRRVPIYTNVSWSTKQVGSGLASYPVTALQNQQERFADPRSVLSKTTITKCVGCPNGGPLAIITLPLTSSSSGFTVTELRILTNAGQPLALLDFPPPYLGDEYGAADVLSLGFTSRCTLVVIFRDSLCVTLNLQGEQVLPPFVLFPNKSFLQHADIFCGGVAALAADTKECCLVELLDQHDGGQYAPSTTSRRIESGNGHSAIITPLLSPSIHAAGHRNLQYCAIAVLPRERTLHRHPEVFLSTSDRSVVVVDGGKDTLVDLQCGMSAPIVDMTFAPNGRFLACFTETAVLTVVSTSFDTKVLDFDTSEGSSSPPLAMEWCGEDSVVLHWKNLGILMVGPYGDWLRFPYTCDTLCCVPELDCCRVVTDTTVEILQRVPAATAQLLRIGSIETTAMLLDASDAYAAGQPTDDAVAAMLENGGLDAAVSTCTDAATKEFDITLQKRLLRAASYGMHFGFKQREDTSLVGGPLEGSEPESGLLPSKTTAEFVAAARKLRILNALRHPDTGFVLTAAQYDSMSPTGVVARLVAMQRPALAACIARFLCLPKSVQLYARAQQAAAFVLSAKDLPDAETAERAIDIINAEEPASWNRGGFATVAMAAASSRPEVAKLLLILETSVADKVPALIATGSYADAIAVATAARDSDFIFSTLMEYEQSVMLPATDPARAQSTMLSTVVSKFTPEAFHMLRRYFQAKGDIKSLTALLLKSQRSADAGSAMALRGLGESDPREKKGMVTEASRIFGLGKETAFHKSSTDDFLELMKDRELNPLCSKALYLTNFFPEETLRNKYGSNDVAPSSSSVAATITAVLQFAATPAGSREQHRLLNDAEKLCRKFRMSDKRFWHIRVKAFAESDQWSNLRLMTENRRPPIGYKPFARAAIKGKRPESEIMRYIDPITVPEERYDLLCEASMWREALSVAESLRDIRRVLNVKSLCNNQSLQLQAEQIMGQLA